MEHRSVRKTDRFAQFAVAAATMAVQDAGIDIRADAERIGCSIGTGIGGLKTEEIAHRKLFEAGPDRLNPFWVTALIPNMGAAEISMALGTRGPLTTECTACAASAMSIGNAVLFIRAGMADAMLAGGVEAPVVPLGLGGFGTMRALSRRNDDPEGASRPFDLGRDGFILAEGGAVLVLEELERARSPRRPHPRRDRGLRHVVGRPPCHRTGSGRRQSGAGDAKRHGRRRGDAGDDRLRERAWHVHSGR